MNLISVTSSNVKGVAYNTATKTLTVAFNSGTYDYFDVSAVHWTEIEKRIADEKVGSIGAYISANIVRGHQFRKHEEPGHG